MAIHSCRYLSVQASLVFIRANAAAPLSFFNKESEPCVFPIRCVRWCLVLVPELDLFQRRSLISNDCPIFVPSGAQHHLGGDSTRGQPSSCDLRECCWREREEGPTASPTQPERNGSPRSQEGECFHLQSASGAGRPAWFGEGVYPEGEADNEAVELAERSTRWRTKSCVPPSSVHPAHCQVDFFVGGALCVCFLSFPYFFPFLSFQFFVAAALVLGACSCFLPKF